jgi:hypothetical protein
MLLLALALTVPAVAQSVVTSAAPTQVSVTIYRDPERDADGGMDLHDLHGFALITETREVELPAGEVTIRFEGVASGIQPETAIVLGAAIKEKNRNRQLLSQRGLLDSFTGQRVILRRTDRATGRVVEEPATIRSAPDRLIVQTAAGFEALNCTGLNQTLLFAGVPRDLTAKPTLSVTAADQAAGRQTITLSYLAGNFDWQANYVAELSPDATTMDLFAWLTMASGDQTSFIDANAFAVAGRPARAARDDDADESDAAPYAADHIGISYQCWPAGKTTDFSQPPAPMAAPAPMMMKMDMARGMELQEVVVAAAHRAVQEELGDLKLYRIPFATTVAAQSQKQVAFLARSNVKGRMIYRNRFLQGGNDEVHMLFRSQNRKTSGLGEALPAGGVAVFQTRSIRRGLVGESAITDKAVGEKVEFELATASNVMIAVESRDVAGGSGWQDSVLTVSNANPFAVNYEAEFSNDDAVRYGWFRSRTVREQGKSVWRVVVPANSVRKLEFRASANRPTR